MKHDIHYYSVGDIVDVYPLKNDIFDEFTGKIVEIDLENDNIIVVDQDDEYYDVYAKQIILAYTEETEEIY
jgi:hypothetical protein